MTQAQNLAQRCREVFLDGFWIANTNYCHQLSTIPYERICQRVNGCNSIAGITLHIHYYIAGLLRCFDTGVLDISDKYSFSAAVPKTEEAWLIMRDEFFRDSESFVTIIASLSDEQLQATFFRQEYGTYQRNIEAMIEHAYYHLGQITLLAKMADHRD